MIRSCDWKEKQSSVVSVLAVTFLPVFFSWKLPILFFFYRYLKTPHALNEAVLNGPLFHFPKSTQFKHPYCVLVKRALYVEYRVLIVGYLYGSAIPGLHWLLPSRLAPLSRMFWAYQL